MSARAWSLIAASILLASSARAASPSAASKLVETLGPLQVGRPVPTFAGWTVDGRMLSLSQFLAPPRAERAEALVVSFFATWCEPCKRALPLLQRAVGAAGPGVRAVLVAYGEDAAQVAPFLSEHGLQVPTIVDPFLKLSQRLGVDKALPRTLVVNGRGEVSAIFEHEGADFEQALAAAVERARRERTIANAAAR
jgi:thiol-disulfide isomerase/thioredoxin